MNPKLNKYKLLAHRVLSNLILILDRPRLPSIKSVKEKRTDLVIDEEINKTMNNLSNCSKILNYELMIICKLNITQ